jgi:hypothetical protein
MELEEHICFSQKHPEKPPTNPIGKIGLARLKYEIPVLQFFISMGLDEDFFKAVKG